MSYALGLSCCDYCALTIAISPFLACSREKAVCICKTPSFSYPSNSSL